MLTHLLETGFFGQIESESRGLLLSWTSSYLISWTDYDPAEIRNGYSAEELLAADAPAEAVSRSVYSTLSYLMSVLPSLGFIGTVLGMSEALIRANMLFDSVDKTGAISEITNRLGVAFDTTFVGLVAVTITGLIINSVHGIETGLWQIARKSLRG